MNVGILGSGFGLYGYLPALLSIEAVRVVLPQRYASRVMDRDDTRSLASRIEWAKDEGHLIAACDAIVLSQRPHDQVGRLPSVLGQPRIRAIALEKPVAPTPALASEVLGSLEAGDRRFRVGFNFRYTPWGRQLTSCLMDRGAEIDSFDLTWKFRAHHYATNTKNWKRFVSSGGGALRFYGIHIIALLAECGYDGVTMSETTSASVDEADAWRATFSGPRLPRCRVAVDCDSPAREFTLRSGAASFPACSLVDPFDETARHAPYDRRVDPVARLCRDLLGSEERSCAWYRAATDLWAATERTNVTQILSPHLTHMQG